MDPFIPSSAAASATRFHGTTVEESSYWAEGDTLIVKRGARLPDRCLLCNAPATTRVTKRFTWHPAWYYLLILGGLLLYVLVALIFSRRMELELPLCDSHRRRRRRGFVIRYAGLLGLIVFPLLIYLSSPPRGDHLEDPQAIALVVAVVAMFITVWTGATLSHISKVKRITATEGRYTASPAFLAASPDHPWSAEV